MSGERSVDSGQRRAGSGQRIAVSSQPGAVSGGRGASGRDQRLGLSEQGPRSPRYLDARIEDGGRRVSVEG
ncbi:MAG: hypothetical protein E3J64_04685 [Anaerolineales bacterium]|nr:MAG: hypothetical protein E3J64_04685 [Anaerolineales bacterium]